MKKIGILTFSKALNYGAKLQTYALSKYLKDRFPDCLIYLLDYPKLTKAQPTLKSRIRIFITELTFSRFNKHLPNYIDLGELDILIIGSDQVWNPQLTQDDFLFFFGPKNIKKIAYACSFGIDSINLSKDIFSSAKNSLDEFHSISIREKSGLNILQEYFKIDNVECVLDPTFLLDSYNSLLLKDYLNSSNNFITVFLFHKQQHINEAINELGRKLDKNTLYLNQTSVTPGSMKVSFPSIEKWLTVISKSNIVFTDSFHCVVFSIIFKVDFIYTPARIDRAGRIISLLSELDLLDRVCYEVNYLNIEEIAKTPINYDEVNKKLSVLVKNSREFLNKSLCDLL